MHRAKRLNNIPPYLFAEIDKKKEKLLFSGTRLIDLSIGDPDLPTPPHIIEKFKQLLNDPKVSGYPPYEGVYEFREAVTTWYKKRFNVSLDPATEVLSLIGSKEGIAHIFLAFIDPGDYALIPDPGYPVYQMGTLLSDGIPYPVPLLESNHFLPDLEKIDKKIARKAKLLFINYPNNPTAAIAPKEFLKQAVDFAKKYNLLLCSDFAYSEVAFEGYKSKSILEIDGAKEVSIEFHSLSKTYNMTGWRIGMAVGNKDALRELSTVKTNIDSGIFKAIQYAAVEAFAAPQDHIQKMNEIYARRRNILINGLNKLGWNLEKTKATFYVWAKVPKDYTSISFTTELLEKAGIVVVPGNGYGKYGEGYFRMSITTSEDKIKEAIKRLKENHIRFK